VKLAVVQLVQLPLHTDTRRTHILGLQADQLAPRINGIVHSVQRVHQAVTRAGLSDDAHDLIEQIENFTHTPLKALYEY
jgi:hypothetical protein